MTAGSSPATRGGQTFIKGSAFFDRNVTRQAQTQKLFSRKLTTPVSDGDYDPTESMCSLRTSLLIPKSDQLPLVDEALAD